MEHKSYYHVQKSPQLALVVNQINPVRIISPFFFKIHFIIIILSTPGSSKVFSFFDQNFVCIFQLSHTPHPYKRQ
jgi:hypothetical protein